MSGASTAAPVQSLEKILNYSFADRSLIKTALTHSSYINEAKKQHQDDNERLEFLGDSVLSLVVTEYLLKNTRMREGLMTRVRASVVCEDMLAKKAMEISLGNFLYLGHGEIIGNGRNRKSILADAFEAVLGAMFLDGGLDVVRSFLLPMLESEIKEHMRTGSEDYKSMLQRFIQQSPDDILEYKLIGETGPAHERIFTSCAVLNNNVIGTGKAGSKRQSEQLAAREALLLFNALAVENEAT